MRSNSVHNEVAIDCDNSAMTVRPVAANPIVNLVRNGRNKCAQSSVCVVFFVFFCRTISETNILIQTV